MIVWWWLIDDSRPHSMKRVALLVLQSADCWSKHQDHLDDYHHYYALIWWLWQWQWLSYYDMLTKRLDLEPPRRDQTKPIDICHKKDKIDEKDDSLGDDDDDESL